MAPSPETYAPELARLRFPPDLERDFRAGSQRRTRPFSRVIIAAGVVLYSAYSAIDLWLFPELSTTLLLIRFAGFVPLVLLTLVASYGPGHTRWGSYLFALLLLTSGISMTIIMVVTPGTNDTAYQMGIVVIALFVYVLAGLPFRLAAVTGWACVIFYNGIVLAVREPSWIDLLNVNYVYVSVNVAGMFASYVLEFAARKEFLRARELEVQQARLARLNEELESRVNERTREAREASLRLEYLAHHDPLTGLRNRRSFEIDLRRRLNAGRPFALLFLDVDRFKAINDALGHHRADEVLQQMAQRISESVRDDDSVVRQGGDEFVVMLGGTADEEAAAPVVDRILDRVRTAFRVDGESLRATVSIGVSFFPHDAPDDVALVRSADSAMRKAKENGRDQVQYYSPLLGATISRRANIERLLSGAIERNEFSMVYQPKIDPRTRTMRGIEALLRWNSREGTISPGIFMPIAEEIGAMREIGRWVLERTLRETVPLLERTDGRFLVSINLSGAQFADSSLVETLTQQARIGGADLSRVRLEIVESSLMADLELTRETLRQVRALGVSIAIDDFGTGYSSLAYLSRFPIDEIKIDKTFVRSIGLHPEDDAIVRTIVLLGQALGLTVVAEGVETNSQLAFLTELGCNLVQGFYYAPGVPIDDLPVSVESGVAYLRATADESGVS